MSTLEDGVVDLDVSVPATDYLVKDDGVTVPASSSAPSSSPQSGEASEPHQASLLSRAGCAPLLR